MKHILCSIYDAKAEFWSAPRMFRTKMDAMRSFELAVNSEDGYGWHPEDFTLWRVGQFCQEDGKIEGEVPLVLANGLELLKEKKINEDA